MVEGWGINHQGPTLNMGKIIYLMMCVKSCQLKLVFGLRSEVMLSHLIAWISHGEIDFERCFMFLLNVDVK